MARESINILVYGPPKSGKTTMAVKRNPNVLVLDTEGSSKHVIGIKREVIRNFGQMDLVLNRIKSGEIKSVIIDTLDELVNNFATEEVKKMGGQYVFNGLLSQAGYGQLRDRFFKIIRSYRDAGADVLTLCHAELVEVPNGGKKWTMKLPSDYAREVLGMMEVIGFMEVVKADGKNVHRLNLTPSPMFDAGCRVIYDATNDKDFSILPRQSRIQPSLTSSRHTTSSSRQHQHQHQPNLHLLTSNHHQYGRGNQHGGPVRQVALDGGGNPAVHCRRGAAQA